MLLRFDRFRATWLAFLLPILGMLPASAAGQSIGGRVGVSAEPDQFYFGAHVETRPLADRLTFRPNIEIGLGDGVTLAALNFEFVYRFPRRQAWGLYAGGGPALNIIRSESRSRAEGGFNILLGVAHREGLFVEAKVGALDSPSFKIGIGYVFR